MPQNLIRYTREHEWARPESSGQLTVGVTPFAADQLGDVVFVELPEVGTRIAAGVPFGTIESVKSVSDLYAPVAGTIVAVNTVLVESPQSVNEDPLGTGWLIRVQPDCADDLASLMSADEYGQMIGELQG
jgi:glycine cleavage system H protein